MSIAVVLLFLTANQVFPEGVGAEWNPTGNPIGGGPGYSDIVTTWDYYVVDAAGLSSALGSANTGDIIYVADTAEIDVSGWNNTFLPNGVTLASGRGRAIADTFSLGGLIFSNTHEWSIWLFRTWGTGENVRITGLRFRGPDSEVGDLGKTVGNFRLSTGIAIYNQHFELDNCEIHGFNNMGINVGPGALGAIIHHNYIHHCRASGLGYGICIDCQGATTGVCITANLFDHCRHGITATGDTVSNYEASYNIFLEHGEWQSADRHGTLPDYQGIGGDSTYVHHNTFRNKYRRAFQGSGQPVEGFWLYDNWCHQPDSAAAFRIPTAESLVYISDNHFTCDPPSGLSARLPVAVANVSSDSGVAPFSVTFDGTGSYDPDGNILVYQWDFGDGNTARGAAVSHTFSEVGIYKVALIVTDNDGIPSRSFVTVKATPPSLGIYYLSLWVKDSYRDDDTGFFFIQVFIDEDTIWTQDVAGDSGWIHISEDVTSSVFEKDSVTVKLKVYCAKDMLNQEFVQLDVYWDDVALFWGDVQNGDMEIVSWDYWWNTQNGTSWSRSINSADPRSGDLSYWSRLQMYKDCWAGNWYQIQQRVKVDNTVGIDDHAADENGKVDMLHIPVPNPATDRSAIAYTIATQSKVSLKIYDTGGRLVKTLADGNRDAGYYQVFWDGFDNKGFSTPNGVYFCRLKVIPEGEGDDYKATQKLVRLR